MDKMRCEVFGTETEAQVRAAALRQRGFAVDGPEECRTALLWSHVPQAGSLTATDEDLSVWFIVARKD